MNNLSLYGWNDHLDQLKQSSTFNSLLHGRVAVAHKTRYEVIAEDGTFQCELTGNMLYSRSPEEYPCTGDWVIFQPFDQDKGIIMDMLPRDKTLYRKKIGASTDRQAIAVYVDKAFIVQSLDDNFNVRRIERMMVQIVQEDIVPALILTKTDLGFDKDEVQQELKHLATRMPIFMTSILDEESVSSLRSYIQPGETVVFTGSSGVGKSSLINALCGREILATSAISDSTGKGRHTSTRREMVLMEQSGVLIDTPGIKVFGVTADNDEALSSILDIPELTKSCRFMDCTHVNEPGCAVIEAVENGTLDQGVYESYLKLRREAWHYSTAEHEKRKHDKTFTKLVREYKNTKDKRKM